MGGEFGGEWTRVYRAESPRCPPETAAALLIGCDRQYKIKSLEKRKKHLLRDSQACGPRCRLTSELEISSPQRRPCPPLRGLIGQRLLWQRPASPRIRCRLLREHR